MSDDNAALIRLALAIGNGPTAPTPPTPETMSPVASHVSVVDPFSGEQRHVPLHEQDVSAPRFEQLQDQSRLRQKPPGDDQFIGAPQGAAPLNDLSFRARSLPGVKQAADLALWSMPDKGAPIARVRQLGGARIPQSMQWQLDPVAVLGMPESRVPKTWVPADTVAAFKFTDLPMHARPSAVYKAIIANGGYTVSPHTGRLVVPDAPGPVMAGKFPNGNTRTVAIPRAQFNPDVVADWFRRNYDIFRKDLDAHIGGWVSGDTVYLDVSKGYTTVRKATKAAERQLAPTATRTAEGVLEPKGQMAVWDPLTGDHPVGNIHEFINSPEFRARMAAMAPIGREAMRGQNWWDITKGPIADTYGKENLPRVAGMIAASSPQSGVDQNLRMASEYVRRLLSNEALIQPHFRMPKDAVGFEPGGGFPFAVTHGNNVRKVADWRMEDLNADKVNDMYHALMGDPNTGVYDRHWAKLAEKPEAGIFADTDPNVLPGPLSSSNKRSPYADVENVVRAAAKDAGVSVADYSAWVWEGIRKTIRETGELFGQQHDAAAIPGNHEGFNDVFVRMVKEKAERKGLTVAEFTERLRTGNASLLSALLATGVGVEALTRWKAIELSHAPTYNRSGDGQR